MSQLSHFDANGQAHMVDVGEKQTTQRVAVASGRVNLLPETLQLIRSHSIEKGDVFELSRIAGIMAAKKTADLIPLCHPLRLSSVSIRFEFPEESAILILATVSANDRTGVEMEALSAVSVCGLTIYDMCKSVDREMTLSDIRLEKKTGGKSGDFVRGQDSRSADHSETSNVLPNDPQR